MEENIIGILKNVSELIVATLVDENEKTVSVKNPAFLGISGQNNQVNINFIPIEVLSLQPFVNIRAFLANPTEDIVYTFDKSSVLHAKLELAQNVKDNYRNMVTQKPQTPVTPTQEAPKSPENNIVKLF